MKSFPKRYWSFIEYLSIVFMLMTSWENMNQVCILMPLHEGTYILSSKRSVLLERPFQWSILCHWLNLKATALSLFSWEWRCVYNNSSIVCLYSLADRSFNDIMQYPVMPWIIADYTSPSLGEPATPHILHTHLTSYTHSLTSYTHTLTSYTHTPSHLHVYV